jgi:hypothetical protein
MRRIVFISLAALIVALLLDLTTTAPGKAQTPVPPPPGFATPVIVVPSPPTGPSGPQAVPAPPPASIVPADVRALVPEKDWVEIYCLETRARTAIAYKAVDEVAAAFASLKPVLDELKVTATLPATAGIKAELDRRVASVCSAPTLDASAAAANALVAYANGPMRDAFWAFGGELEAALRGTAGQVETQIKKEIDDFVASEKSSVEARLKNDIQAEVTTRLFRLGRAPGPQDIAEAQTKAMEIVQARIPQLQAEITQKAMQRAQQSADRVVQRMSGIGATFQQLGERLSKFESAPPPEAAGFLKQALEKRAQMITRVVDAQMKKARDQALSGLGNVPPEEKAKIEALFADLNKERDALIAQLKDLLEKQDAAGAMARVRQFQQLWEAKGKELETMRASAVAVCRQVGQSVADGRPQFIKARDQLRAVAALPSAIATKRDAALAATVAALAAMDAVQSACADPGADLRQMAPKLDDLKAKVDRARALLDELKRLQPATAPGLLVEAEDEVRAVVAKPGTNWDSVEEKKPSWRPPYSGTGSWYLSREGDRLEYQVQLLATGKYVLWIRDFRDFRNPAVRPVRITIDGKKIGEFPGNSEPVNPQTESNFAWHVAVTVDLAAGAHTIVVEKVATTSGAAILDAFFFAADPNARPPEPAAR